MPFIAACAAYPIDWFNDWQAYVDKLTAWVEAAANENAQLLVFPEYGAMELVSLFDKTIQDDMQKQIDVISELAPDIDDLHAALAAKHNITILASSLPCRLNNGRAVNRASLFGSQGLIGYQDKLIMTRFERNIWHISSGKQIEVFDTDLGRIGITICYDSEFPMIARSMTERGAKILLAPSCTDTLAGYYRVRTGAMARALENQCYTLHAPTVGQAQWLDAADVNVGAAAIYGPSDIGFPANGIINSGDIDGPGWIYAEVDLDKVNNVRKNGTVLNYQHWSEQFD